MVLLYSSSVDLQLAVSWFAAECLVSGIGVITSKCEAIVLSWKTVECPLWVGNELLLQVKDWGTSQQELERWIGAASALWMWMLYQSVLVRRVKMYSYCHL